MGPMQHRAGQGTVLSRRLRACEWLRCWVGSVHRCVAASVSYVLIISTRGCLCETDIAHCRYATLTPLPPSSSPKYHLLGQAPHEIDEQSPSYQSVMVCDSMGDFLPCVF